MKGRAWLEIVMEDITAPLGNSEDIAAPLGDSDALWRTA